MTQDFPLPDGWKWVTIGELAESIHPGFPSGQHNQEKIGVPHIRPMNISRNGDVDLSVVKYVEPKTYSSLIQGDVLFNNTNSPELVGKTTYIRQNTNWVFSNHMTCIRLNKNDAFPGWVANALHYLYITGYFKLVCRHHVNQASIGSTFLAEKVFIPLPPLPEQERIVAKIEELFTQLEAGTAALRRIQAGLKRYKASVLKAACEGRLVEQELFDDLDGDFVDKPVTLPLEGGDVTSLPKGWQWKSIENTCEKIVDCLHSTPKFQEKGFYCLDSTWIKPGRFIFEKKRFVDEATFIERNRRMKPQPDDVVFSREGALLGVAVRIPNDFEFCLGQRMMIFRPSKELDGKYLENFLNSAIFRKNYAKQITGTASPHLNIKDIRQFKIPLPPLEEQRRIVSDVERRLSIITEVEATADAALARSARLRQSILKRAFIGKL